MAHGFAAAVLSVRLRLTGFDNFRDKMKPSIHLHDLFDRCLSEFDVVIFEQISPQAKPSGCRILFLQIQYRVDRSEIDFAMRIDAERANNRVIADESELSTVSSSLFRRSHFLTVER